MDEPIHTQRGKLGDAVSFGLLQLRLVEVIRQSGLWSALHLVVIVFHSIPGPVGLILNRLEPSGGISLVFIGEVAIFPGEPSDGLDPRGIPMGFFIVWHYSGPPFARHVNSFGLETLFPFVLTESGIIQASSKHVHIYGLFLWQGGDTVNYLRLFDLSGAISKTKKMPPNGNMEVSQQEKVAKARLFASLWKL